MARILALGLVAVLAAGCASAGGGTSARRDRDLITADEIQGVNVSNALDLIRRLRPSMLRRMSTTSMTSVVVYIDGIRQGSGEQFLQGIPAANVRQIEYLTESDAMLRYGMNHPAGAILISTQSARGT